MKKILFIGGSGKAGRDAISYILEHSDASIRVSTLNSRPDFSGLDRYASRLSHCHLDVFSEQELRSEVERYDLVVSAAGPSCITGTRVIDAAWNTGTAVVDVGGYDPAFRYIDRKKQEVQNTAPVIINAGLLPGLSGVFPLELIREFRNRYRPASRMSLDECYVGRDAWSVNSSRDIIYGMAGFGEKPRGTVHFRNGKLEKVPFFKALRKQSFPGTGGTVPVMMLYAEELARLMREQNLRDLDVYGANIGKRAARSLMFTGLFRRFRNMDQINASARRLARASAADLKTAEPYYGITCRVGDLEGHTLTRTLTMGNTYRGTAMILGITACMVLEGRCADGAGSLHQMVPSDQIMNALLETGAARIA